MTLSLKSLHPGDLKLIAMAVVFEEEDAASDVPCRDVEYDVVPGEEEAFNKHPLAGIAKCDCCGHNLKYVCVVRQLSTNQTFSVGRTCAMTLDFFARQYGDSVGATSVALALRIECNRREKSFVTQHPECAEAIAWVRAKAHKFGTDLVEKIRRYGELSEAQIKRLAEIPAREQARLASLTASAPSGRLTLTGTIVSLKQQKKESVRPHEKPYVPKVLVQLESNVKAWGTLPDAQDGVVAVGDKVSFCATFSPSATDPGFCTFKRPTKFEKA